MDSVTYAVSSPDMLALSPAVRECVEAVLHPHMEPTLGVLTTQRGGRIKPLAAAPSEVLRAIFRTKVMASTMTPVRFYKAYAPGYWDLIPSMEAVARMRVEEGSDGGI